MNRGRELLCTNRVAAAANGMEECRRCCGGHGYLQSSGLVLSSGFYVQSCTAEGENKVIVGQTTRYLLKVMGRAAKGQPLPDNCNHLNASNMKQLHTQRCTATTAQDFNNPELQVEAFRYKAAAAIAQLVQEQVSAHTPIAGIVISPIALIQATLRASGMSEPDIWCETLVQVNAAAHAHAHLTVVRNFALRLSQLQSGSCNYMGHNEISALDDMRNLFALHLILSDLTPWLLAGYMTAEQVGMIRSQYKAAMARARVNAVALCDAWDHTDMVRNDAIVPQMRV